MDPNLSKLDPKLREAYDRVMNGPTPAPPTGGPATQTPATPPPISNQPGPTPVHSNPPAGGPPPMPPLGNAAPPPPPPVNQTMSTPAVDPTPAINSTIAFNAHDSGVNKGTTGVKKGSGGMVKVLMLALVIIAFLVIYTVVWVYLFHLKLPFIG